MLKEIFKQVAASFTSNTLLAGEFWQEIEQKYAGSNRYYHNLQHLENLLTELLPYKAIIKDWEVLLFSICYHDVVYKVTNHDNEEKSAQFAEQKLLALLAPAPAIDKCRAQIIATKTHIPTGDTDTDLFTDADLSILGKPWETYHTYCGNIRKEYKIYPDVLYKPARKKVLQHFMQMDRIFKTPQFFGKYEGQARRNLQQEMELLSN